MICFVVSCTFLIISSAHLQVINHQPYDQKADVFSFAIVLWELVTAKVLYELSLLCRIFQHFETIFPLKTYPLIC